MASGGGGVLSRVLADLQNLLEGSATGQDAARQRTLNNLQRIVERATKASDRAAANLIKQQDIAQRNIDRAVNQAQRRETQAGKRVKQQGDILSRLTVGGRQLDIHEATASKALLAATKHREGVEKEVSRRGELVNIARAVKSRAADKLVAAMLAGGPIPSEVKIAHQRALVGLEKARESEKQGPADIAAARRREAIAGQKLTEVQQRKQEHTDKQRDAQNQEQAARREEATAQQKTADARRERVDQQKNVLQAQQNQKQLAKDLLHAQFQQSINQPTQDQLDAAANRKKARMAANMLGKMTMHAHAAGFPGLAKASYKAELGMRAAAGDPTAIAALVAGHIKEAKDAAVGVPTEVGRAFTSRRIGEAGAHLFKSVGHAGHLMSMAGAPALGIPIEGLAKLGEVTFGAVDKLRDWSKSLADANMQFAEFSGAMAGVQARQEVREIQLSMFKGAGRAESTEQLNQARMELERFLAPWENKFSELQSAVTVDLIHILKDILTPVDQIMRHIVKVEDAPKGVRTMDDILKENVATAGANFGVPSRHFPGL